MLYVMCDNPSKYGSHHFEYDLDIQRFMEIVDCFQNNELNWNAWATDILKPFKEPFNQVSYRIQILVMVSNRIHLNGIQSYLQMYQRTHFLLKLSHISVDLQQCNIAFIINSYI